MFALLCVGVFYLRIYISGYAVLKTTTKEVYDKWTCFVSQVKREEEGGRGSYKFLQFLTLPPKAQMSGVTFHFNINN